MSFSILITALKGSSSSGNYGHAGRLGKKGGSAPKSGIGAAMSLRTGANATQRQASKLPIRAAGLGFVTLEDELEQQKAFRVGLPPPDYSTPVTGSTIDGWQESTQGKVKDEIVTNLSNATGLGYEAVNDAIHQWANSSNDRDYRSLSMQESAARVFDTKLSDWQKERIGKAHSDAGSKGMFTDNHQPYTSPEAATDALLRNMHAQTQEFFQKQGITSLVVYRGTRGSLGDAKPGDVVSMKSNAMESWTLNSGIAKEFGYNVIKAEIPVSRIVGTARTGFGCLNEFEVVVVGGKNDDTVAVQTAFDYNKGA